MLFRSIPVVLIAALCHSIALVSPAKAEAQGIIVQYLPGTVLPDVRQARALLQQHRIEHADQLFDDSMRSRKVMQALLASYRADPRVVYAEPNHLGRFADVPAPVQVPTDPAFPQQWWADAVSARKGWAISTGRDITVAVIDTGVDVSHPDLVANLRSDGFNFGNGTANVQDLNGHGTAIAGLIASSCGNATGGCGLAYGAKILPIKLNPGNSSTFDSATLAQSIRYAVQQGAQIINLSLTVDAQTQTVATAIDQALAAGVVVVAAAGNSSAGVQFPGNHPGVLAVAGSGMAGELDPVSSRGQQVTVAAPGIGLVSTQLGGGTGVAGSGTSFAAPLVSAAAAQMLALDRRLTSQSIKTILVQSSKPLAGQTFGILDVGAALYAMLPDLLVSSKNIAQGTSGWLEIAFQVPATGGAVDLFFSIETPWGEYSLAADGTWQPGGFKLGLPAIAGHQAPKSVGGKLYGVGGIFPPLPMSDLALGQYRLKAGAFASGTSQPLGPDLNSIITVRTP